MNYLIYCVGTFSVAFLVSMIGIGGSFLYIPLLMWLGQDYKTAAIPTALLLNVTAAAGSQFSYIKRGMTKVRAAVVMAAGAVLSAQIGASLNRYMPAETLKILFALLILIAALRIIFFENADIEKGRGTGAGFSNIVAFSAGVCGGFLSGLFGIGGGLVIMPALLFMGFPPKNSAATSLLVVLFSSGSAFIGHIGASRIDVRIAAVCVLSVFAGAKTGSAVMSDRFRQSTIRILFAGVLLLVALKLFIEAL